MNTKILFTADPSSVNDHAVPQGIPPAVGIPSDAGNVLLSGTTVYNPDLDSFLVSIPQVNEREAMIRDIVRMDGTDPRRIVIDHPKFRRKGMNRRSDAALTYYEIMTFRPLRDTYGESVPILQFAVGETERERELCPSATPSITLYNPAIFEDAKAGLYSHPQRGNRVDADLLLDGMHAGWIPAVGQWVGAGGGQFWTHDTFRRAMDLLYGRVPLILIWFDPRPESNRWTMHNYGRTMATLSHHVGWPAVPVQPRPTAPSWFSGMLRILSDPDYDHGGMLTHLSDFAHDTEGRTP